tara:strand:- start:227 stop:460 length:234 start_codon:yes stop_codon:yes gene_type:complete
VLLWCINIFVTHLERERWQRTAARHKEPIGGLVSICNLARGILRATAAATAVAAKRADCESLADVCDKTLAAAAWFS